MDYEIPKWAHRLVATFHPGTATTLNVWNGRPVQFLVPIDGDGAMLWWEFDERDDESSVGVAVHLTDAEAQTVFETPPTVGMLERVRLTLTDTTAILFAIARGSSAHQAIEIPRGGTEEDFIDFLLDESEDIRLTTGIDKVLVALTAAAAPSR